MPNSLRAGTAKVDITPPLTVPYLGHLPRQAYFEGVHDRLYARALYLDHDGARMAVVALDALGVSRSLPGGDIRANVLDALPARLGLDQTSLMLCASHCHSAPETAGITSLHHLPGGREWLSRLAHDLAGCIQVAAASAQPAELRFGEGEVRDISANRRMLDKNGVLHKPPDIVPPEHLARPALIDPATPVLRFDLADGTHSVLFGFTCHPTTVQVNPLVSADYPGVAAALVERESPGCRECLFIQGACGDVNPIQGSHRPNFPAVQENGAKLGREVLNVLGRIKDLPPIKVARLAAMVREVEFPRRPLPGPSPLREEIYDLLAQASGLLIQREMGTALATDVSDPEAARQLLLQARAQVERLAEIARGPHPIRSVIQAVRLGEVAIVGVPGEPFVELGLEIKRGSPAELTICAGYANDYVGYLSHPRAFAEGGYETSLGPWCPVGPAGGGLAVQTALAMLHELWQPGA